MSKIVYDASLFFGSGDEIYDLATQEGGLCIDGGAAAGFLSKKLAVGGCEVYAFEPFPGNIPYFKQNLPSDIYADSVRLYEKALGSKNETGRFYVGRVVDEGQKQWGEYSGYSSEGFLVSNNQQKNEDKDKYYDVEIVRLDNVISNKEVTLLKLDLQGGEYDALVGAGESLSNVKYCYVEFSLHFNTLHYLLDNNFIVFDTEYTGIPKVSIDEVISSDIFSSYKIINLSNGYKAISGFLKGTPREVSIYEEFMLDIKYKYFHHLWSDLIAINRSKLGGFYNQLGISLNLK